MKKERHPSLKSGKTIVAFWGIILAIQMFCWAESAFSETMSTSIRPTKGAFVNLGDYAKGDGTDETEAIQAAFDALPPANGVENVVTSHPGGVLYIPRPQKFYGISKTIKISEKWNCTIICETHAIGTRGPIEPLYFRWLGADNSTMFVFRMCKGMKLENFSLCGMDEKSLQVQIDRGWTPPEGQRLTKNVTGILFGPDEAAGFQNAMTIDKLTIRNVSTGISLGNVASNGPDVTMLSFRGTAINEFSEYGIVAASGNLAAVTFDSLETSGWNGAKATIYIKGGELLVLNWTATSGNGKGKYAPDPNGAQIIIETGGIHVVKGWSEWWGPLLKTVSPQTPEVTYSSAGSVSFPTILEGIRHFDGPWGASESDDPVPISISYDRPVPLNLIGCSLWGDVEIGARSQGIVISSGTVFINKNRKGFIGEGATKYGRVIQIGVPDEQNSRILRPYVIDRSSVPGTEAPTSGVWETGDGIINTQPDPSISARAWKGWVCVEGGEPGRWAPYGKLGSAFQP